ncbi:hypothetical protein ACO0RG_001495 [Hanseniaspora osmophila]
MSEPSIVIPLKQWNDLLTHLNDIAESLKANQAASTEGVSGKTAENPNNQAYVPVHKSVYCDGKCGNEITRRASYCHREPIKGDRYKCLECYNYDLCSSCEDAKVESGSHKNFHNMNNGNVSASTQSKTSCKSSGTHTDVVFDISDKDKDLFDFFSKLDTVEKLRGVMNKVVNYDELLIQYEALLPKTLPKSVFPTPSAKTAESFSSSTLTSSKDGFSTTPNFSGKLGNPGIYVDFGIKNKKEMVFKILNSSNNITIPTNCILNFNFVRKSTHKMVKCYLQMSKSQEVKPLDSFKINFNHVFQDGDFLNESEHFEVKIMHKSKFFKVPVVLYEAFTKTLAHPVLLNPSVEGKTALKQEAARENLVKTQQSSTKISYPSENVTFSPDVLSVEETLKKIERGILFHDTKGTFADTPASRLDNDVPTDDDNERADESDEENISDDLQSAYEEELDDYDILSNSDLD